jgi:hypothetical protein
MLCTKVSANLQVLERLKADMGSVRFRFPVEALARKAGISAIRRLDVPRLKQFPPVMPHCAVPPVRQLRVCARLPV